MAEDIECDQGFVDDLKLLELEADNQIIALDTGPDFGELCDERQQRNTVVMQQINRRAASETIRDEEAIIDSEDKDEFFKLRAAIVIQSQFRGYLARCKYVELLYNKYEEEERERQERADLQAAEGELLVENNRLMLEIEDKNTEMRNRHRYIESKVITIQRYWRKYRRRKAGLDQPNTTLAWDSDSDSDVYDGPLEELSACEIPGEHGGLLDELTIQHQPITNDDSSRTPSARPLNSTLNSARVTNNGTNETEKEHSAMISNGQQAGDGELSNGEQSPAVSVSYSGQSPAVSVSYSGQSPAVSVSHSGQVAAGYVSPSTQRKNELLSLAQEFINLKKQFENVLPYNAHEATLLSDSSTEASCSESPLTTPSLEDLKQLASSPVEKSPAQRQSESSKLASASIMPKSMSRGSPLVQRALNNRMSAAKSVKDSHREDVRKRLAMNTPSDSALYSDLFGSGSRLTYGSSSSLQLYINEYSDSSVDEQPSDTADKAEVDLLAKSHQLQEQATAAYNQAGPMARKMLQVEKMSQEPTEVAKMLGITSFGKSGEVTLSKARLSALSVAQLQVVVNAIHNEIERLNEELVHIVVTKDEFHMQQDSLLVTIEDMKERIEEQAIRHEKRIAKKEARASQASKDSTKAQAGGKLARLNKLFRFRRS